MTRAAAAIAAAAALVLGGCETTQQQSARIGLRLGHQSARAGTTRIGARNRVVRVVRTAIVAGSPAAVAVELTNTSATAQAAIPVLIAARDAKGATVYRNDTRGIQPSLQQLALLPAHTTAWWVDNEVLASGGAATAVTVQVGAASATRTVPRVAARDPQASDSFPGPHVDVTVHSAAAAAQSQLPLYAVAIRAGRVVGAGRALIPSLGGGASATAEIPMTGAVSGATIAITVAPSPGR